MQRALTSAARLARQQARAASCGQIRLAGGQVAVADESPYLRYATPVPVDLSGAFANLLGSIPATQVEN